MQHDKNLESCKICLNRKLDWKRGLLCKLTDNKPGFVGDCPNFRLDKEEENMAFRRKLVVVGDEDVGDPHNFEKNKRNGAMYFWIGLFIVFTMHAVFAPIGLFVIAYSTLVYGIIQYYKGVAQEKIFKDREERKDSQL